MSENSSNQEQEHANPPNSPTKSITEEVISDFKYIRKYATATLSRQANDSIWVNFDNLPLKALRFIVFTEFALWFAIMFYFAVTSYISQSTQYYIALDKGSGYCTPVPSLVNIQSFIGLNNGDEGIWSSSPHYLANTTAIMITLESFKSNEGLFEDHLQMTSTKLYDLGVMRGVNRGLPWNLIVWSTFTHTIATMENGRYTFTLMGDVTSIFKTKLVYASVGSMYGLCQPDKTRGYYDLVSNSYVLVIKDYFSDGPIGKCPDQGYLTNNSTVPNIRDPYGIQKQWDRNVSNSINAAAFGYDPLTAITNDLTLYFDMRSIAVALAVNMEIIDISELLVIPMEDMDEAARAFPFEFCNVQRACSGLNVTEWASFYAPRYVGMEPLYCIGVVNAVSNTTQVTRYFCFIRSGSMILYPSIQHRENCTCSLVQSNATLETLCNKHNFLITLVYYSWETYAYFPLTLAAIVYLKYGFYSEIIGDDFFNIYVRPAAVAAARGVFPNENVTAEEIKNAFEKICPFYPCSIIQFQANDPFTHIINGFAFQIAKGACKNTVYSEGTIADIAANVPFSFTEKYFSCQTGMYSSLLFAIGVSSGNATIMTQILMFFVAFIVGMYLKFVHNYDTGFVTGYEAKNRKKRVKETKLRSRVKRLAHSRTQEPDKDRNNITSDYLFRSAFGESFYDSNDGDEDDEEDEEGARSQISDSPIRCLFSNDKEMSVI